MPELPEVEATRRLLHRRLAGRTLGAVEVFEDPIVYEGVEAERWVRALSGARVERVQRHGKHLWWVLDRRPWPAFHLGMTGRFQVHGPQGQVAVGPPGPLRADPAARPYPDRWIKLRLRLHDGWTLAFANKRRLGRARLRDRPLQQPPLSRLGPDPLLALPSPDALADTLARRTAAIKAVLLDQRFLAGLGNWLADEVLYRARIAPHRRARDLARPSPLAVVRLHAAIREVLQIAVAANAHSDRFPPHWLFHRRWGRDPDARTADGHPLRFDTIAGRTTAWVPAVQGED